MTNFFNIKTNKYFLICLLFLIFGANSFAQKNEVFNIIWEENNVKYDQQGDIFIFKSENLPNHPEKDFNPVFNYNFKLKDGFNDCDVKIKNVKYSPISKQEIELLTFKLNHVDTNNIKAIIGQTKNTFYANIEFVPVIIDKNENYYKIESFELDIVQIPVLKSNTVNNSYATTSKLASGNWYKIKLNKSGIYKVTYADMQNMGINMSSVTPKNIKLYGYGGSMLPEGNNIPNYDDLKENAIQVVSANPDKFESNDYFLFYGEAPDVIYFDTYNQHYTHQTHLYDDYTYYFINTEGEDGLRITDVELSNSEPNYTTTYFEECLYYEKNLVNLLKSGKEWLGEELNSYKNNISLPTFSFKNPYLDKYVKLKYSLHGQTSSTCKVDIKGNNNLVSTVIFGKPGSDYSIGMQISDSRTFEIFEDELTVNLNLTGSNSDKVYLNYIELIVYRKLHFVGPQMIFADPSNVGINNVTLFNVSNSVNNLKIWEITTPVSVNNVPLSTANNQSTFKLKTDNQRKFIAFDESDFFKVEFVEKTPNQNLHGLKNTDYLIICYEPFLSEANKLAEFHRSHSNFKVEVIPVKTIYNEFSSGMQDISAIRNFIRMMYNSPEHGKKLKYVLMFGDGSFDYKDKIPNNTNFIPTFQNDSPTTSHTSSTQSDDFYGLLDYHEGKDAFGLVDVGLGRFPVKTIEEARIAVEKTIFYITKPKQSLGEWRNKICLISDDKDSNSHINHSEDVLAKIINDYAKEFNVEKIYIDAFKQVISPSGVTYPEVNTAISSEVKEGTLFVGYTGHGGEKGWADESILNIPEIQSWTNWNNMPVFMTATCEFSRYDDPTFTSAGELVFLNSSGGAPAMFTTTRLATTSTNNQLTSAFYDTLFSNSGKNFTRFGDLLTYSKVKVGGAFYAKNFILFGDPTLTLGIPVLNVKTTEINGIPIENYNDTLKAMMPVKIKGIIADDNGNIINDYQGNVKIQVFDKPQILQTLGNDPSSIVRDFKVQKNLIFKGISKVTNGTFEASFILPKDIDYSFGNGKISYYAYNNTQNDANGFDTTIVIGGAGSIINDDNGPEIELFIDNFYFKNGDKTSTTPLLLAKLKDQNGINIANNSIGHEITAYIDDNYSEIIQLNKYYQADTNSYQSGLVTYKLDKLSVGKHTLTLKVWDIMNNANTATIEFEVVEDYKIEITNLIVYPNPFKDFFSIEMDVNLYDEDVDLFIELVDITGKRVSTIANNRFRTQGFHIGPIHYENNIPQSLIKRGLYGLQVHLKSKGNKTSKGTKLIRF